MPTEAGKRTREKMIAERDARRVAKNDGLPAGAPDPNKNRSRVKRDPLPTQSELRDAREKRRLDFNARNREASAREAKALREARDARAERIRRERLQRSDVHKQRSARAAANETAELDHLRARRASELSGGGVRVSAGREPGRARPFQKERRGGKQAESGENKMILPGADDDSQNKGGPEQKDALAGLAFASPQAEANARDAGLTKEDFRSAVPSGVNGFTARDVENARKARDEKVGG